MLEITIEKRVPIPAIRKVYAYPYEKMAIGDSFVVPLNDRAKVLNANWRAGKRFKIKLSAKTQGDVVRTWRIE